jgi:hypothetical protein
MRTEVRDVHHGEEATAHAHKGQLPLTTRARLEAACVQHVEDQKMFGVMEDKA